VKQRRGWQLRIRAPSAFGNPAGETSARALRNQDKFDAVAGSTSNRNAVEGPKSHAAAVSAANGAAKADRLRSLPGTPGPADSRGRGAPVSGEFACTSRNSARIAEVSSGHRHELPISEGTCFPKGVREIFALPACPQIEILSISERQ